MVKIKKQAKGKPTLKEEARPIDWNKAPVILTLVYFQHEKQCFSDWNKREMTKFWGFSRKLHQMSWLQVYETASKGADKRGMAYTVIPREKYIGVDFIKNLSDDINMFELRVDDKMRVHGFREKQFFHLCLLDREHKYCAE